MNDHVVSTNHLKNLKLLARGCPDHPAYRAKRPPRVQCGTCAEMFEAVKHVSLKEQHDV